MYAKLLDLLKIHEEEVSLFLWVAALLFIIRSSGIILNNYAETAFLKRYGGEYLPMVNILNAVATFFVTGDYGPRAAKELVRHLSPIVMKPPSPS